LLMNLRPADEYDEYARGFLGPWDDLCVRRMKMLLGARRDRERLVVDIGAATGAILIRLAQESAFAGCRFLAIDPDDSMLEVGRQRAASCGVGERVAFQVGDAHALPCGDGEAALALSRATLHHLERPALALHEMFRVIEPGGYALVHDMRRDVPAEAFRHFAQLRASAGYPSTHLEEKYTLEEVQDIVLASGLGGNTRVLSNREGLAALGYEILIRKPIPKET
jgi:ubiquinone/menaquinone biosynthesis C-methylase UbiE